MAEDDGYEAMEDFDFEWVYVEDDFPLSDELAEMQIPDPGYAGTNFEIYLDHDDQDWIGYWDDREYVDDEYWDNAQLGALASKLPTAKRKREEVVKESPGAKRRRLVMERLENVKYVSLAKRLERYMEPPPSLGSVKPFALLPDWKERFANESGVIVEKAMPEAMKKAAEAQDEDTPPKKRQFDALVEDGDEEEWMDEDKIEEGDEDAGDMPDQPPLMDQDLLKEVLKQKLAEAGLGDVDESGFMATIEKMLAGDENVDDATGELADALVGKATEGGQSAILGFLSQMGVTLPDSEEDDASSVATAEMPSAVGSAFKSSVEVSPPDSAIEMLKQPAETKQMAIHGSSPSTSAKKRSAPPTDEDAVTKRKKVVFDVPSSSQSTQPAVDGDGEEEVLDDTASHRVENSDAPAATPPIQTQASENGEATTSDDPLMSEPTVHSNGTKSSTNAAAAKSANEKAVKDNKAASTQSTGARNYAKPTAAASAKQTRKRKAEADDEDVENVSPKQKRPARKAAKAEPKVPEAGPPALRTRSARAKAGK